MEYTHDEAVADQVNVDFDVYRIRTEITEQGSTIDAGLVTAFRDRQTRRLRWETLLLPPADEAPAAQPPSGFAPAEEAADEAEDAAEGEPDENPPTDGTIQEQVRNQ